MRGAELISTAWNSDGLQGLYCRSGSTPHCCGVDFRIYTPAVRQLGLLTHFSQYVLSILAMTVVQAKRLALWDT